FRVFRGLVASSDAFHAEEEYSRRWRKLNIIGVEMECATLFTLARLRGFRAAAVLMVIDNLEDGTAMKLDEIRDFEEKALKTALKALTEIK
ncbi:MAG: nucleoside phosphorylase, partial [Thermoprotei archaeon]